MCTMSLQLCPTLYNPVDCSLPGSSLHGILQEEYWSGLLCPPPGDLPNPGIELLGNTSDIAKPNQILLATSLVLLTEGQNLMDLSLLHIQLKRGPNSVGEDGILPSGVPCREKEIGQDGEWEGDGKSSVKEGRTIIST